MKTGGYTLKFQMYVFFSISLFVMGFISIVAMYPVESPVLAEAASNNGVTLSDTSIIEVNA